MDMDQRASTDGCLNCEGVPTDGCSQLYVGDIEIRLENFDAIKSSHKLILVLHYLSQGIHLHAY